MAGLAIATRLGGAAVAPAAEPAPPPAPAPAPAPAAAAATNPVPQDDGFRTTVLPRHGRRPLGFAGRLLVEAGITTDANGVRLPVASRIALYETAAGGIVAAISHVQPGQDVPAISHAEPFADCESLKTWLGTHDPLADLPVQALLPDNAEALPPVMALAAAGREIARIRAAFHALLAALLAPMADVDPAEDSDDDFAATAASHPTHHPVHAEGTARP